MTEDAHTALRLHRKRWGSAYLRLPLAAGLATERLILHVGQRVRWARGMLQILRLDNPLFGAGLSLGQRLCYLNAMMHFFFALPRVVFLTSPLAFLLFNQNLIAASPLAITAYALPHIFHSVATNARIQGSWRHSFWSEIYETVLALFLVRITAVTMISPRRGRFNVTDKGGLLKSGYFDMAAVYPNILLCGILFIGWGRGLFGMLVQHTTRLQFQALMMNTIWITLSILIVLAALAVGRETRQIRNRARIRARLPVVAWLPDGRALQGSSHNLSLGGSALMIERPEGVPPEGMLQLEFSLGQERLMLDGQIKRWEGRFLQVSWLTPDIAAESRVAQLVFGRADAWVDWGRYPLDRPLVSFWNVLVSIRGLFRERGRSIAVPDLPMAPAAVATTGPATLARQSLVLRPRTGMGAGSRAAVLLLCGLLGALPGLARAQSAPAQVPMPTLLRFQLPSTPPGSAPQGQGAPVPGAAPVASPLPAAPAAPALTTAPALPGAPGPSAAPALSAAPGLPATPPGTAPPAAAVPASDTRTVELTLHDLGALGPMTMRGTSTIQGLIFGIRADEVVTSARLSLSGAMSPALLPDTSNVTVTLNEQYVGTIPVTPSRAEFGPLEMSINPVFFQDRNRMNFRFTGRYTQDCNDPLSGLLWSTISDRSTLTLSIVRLPPRRDLSRLPLPLFDENVRQKLVLPFVLAGNPGNETLQAAAIIASWFGKLTDFRGVSFPVNAEPPQEGNAVLVAVGRDLPPGLNLPPLSGPTIAEVANPNDPLATLLVVAGRTGAETIAAANTLSLGSRMLNGRATTVPVTAIPPRRPYDAPAWIRTDRPVKFGELVDAATLQGTGYVPGTFHVPFRTAPDLYTWRRRPFDADIHFRSPPGPIIDVAASRLDVSINSIFLRSFSLAPRDGTLDWVSRTLGFARPVRYGVTPIPVYTVFGANDLQLFFDARPLHRGDCVAIPDDVHMAVDADSTLDLTSAYHFTALPNLAFFVNSGFPFTRMADLSDTAVVLPNQPSSVELSAFLDLMGTFGALTFQPVNRVTVVRPDDLTAVADKDLLLLATLGHAGAAAGLLARSPYSIDGNSLHVRLPNELDGIWRLFGDTTGEDRQRAAVALTAPLGEASAALIGAQSPTGYKRSVVALLGGSPQALEAMVEAMRNPKLVPDIQGDLTLLAGGTVTAYRAGGIYTVGELPFWLIPEWWLQDRPTAVVLIMLVAAGIMGTCLYRVLRWRAGRRVARRRATTQG